jgi:hypothetical protein
LNLDGCGRCDRRHLQLPLTHRNVTRGCCSLLAGIAISAPVTACRRKRLSLAMALLAAAPPGLLPALPTGNILVAGVHSLAPCCRDCGASRDSLGVGPPGQQESLRPSHPAPCVHEPRTNSDRGIEDKSPRWRRQGVNSRSTSWAPSPWLSRVGWWTPRQGPRAITMPDLTTASSLLSPAPPAPRGTHRA